MSTRETELREALEDLSDAHLGDLVREAAEAHKAGMGWDECAYHFRARLRAALAAASPVEPPC